MHHLDQFLVFLLALAHVVFQILAFLLALAHEVHVVLQIMIFLLVLAHVVHVVVQILVFLLGLIIQIPAFLSNRSMSSMWSFKSWSFSLH